MASWEPGVNKATEVESYPPYTDAKGTVWPVGRAYAWVVVFVLAISFSLSVIDRKFLGLVIEMIKVDLHLSDFMVGMLLGPSFAVFYIVMGVPFGWLADRGDRRLIMALGMTVWCLATSATGLAGGVLGIFAARLLVGIGEATLSPSAMSLLGDYFPPKYRARATSIYTAGALVGSGSGYLIGAPLITWVEHRGPIGLSYFDHLNTWQATMVVLGLPGLIISTLLFFLHEPRRGAARLRASQGPAMAVRKPGVSVKMAVGYMLKQWRGFALVIGGCSAMNVLGYLSLWFVPIFERTWGWSVQQFGVWIGVMTISNAVMGAVINGWIGDWSTARGRTNGPMIALILSAILSTPTYALFALMPSAPIAIAVLWVGQLGQAIQTAAGPTAVMQLSPDRIRGQAISWYYLICNISGLLLGPPAVGLLTDLLGGKHMLKYTIFGVSAVFGVISILTFLWAAVHFHSASLRAREGLEEPMPA